MVRLCSSIFRNYKVNVTTKFRMIICTLISFENLCKQEPFNIKTMLDYVMNSIARTHCPGSLEHFVIVEPECSFQNELS